MSKTIFALVTAGILGAAMVPNAAHATTTGANVTRSDLRKDHMVVHQEKRMLRHAVRSGDFDRTERLRHNIHMDRNDFRRDRILRHETLK